MAIDISFIFPCYNEMPHLPRSIAAVRSALADVEFQYELIFIEDGGDAATREYLQSLAGLHPSDRFLYNEVNQGRGAAIIRGIRECRGEYAFVLDVDLEIAPAEALRLLPHRAAGHQVITGKRCYQWSLSPYGWWRWLMSRTYKLLAKLVLWHPYSDTETGCKLLQRNAVLPLLEQCRFKHFFWDTEIMVRAWLAGLRVYEQQVRFVRNGNKKTTVRVLRHSLVHFISLLQLKWYMVRQLYGFTAAPDKTRGAA